FASTLSSPALSFSYTVTSTTHIYTLSLHDALPISITAAVRRQEPYVALEPRSVPDDGAVALAGPAQAKGDLVVWDLRVHNHLLRDRKSTRLNSSHVSISYAVFCLKKKKKNTIKQSI